MKTALIATCSAFKTVDNFSLAYKESRKNEEAIQYLRNWLNEEAKALYRIINRSLFCSNVCYLASIKPLKINTLTKIRLPIFQHQGRFSTRLSLSLSKKKP